MRKLTPAVLFTAEQKKLGYLPAVTIADVIGCNPSTVNRWYYNEHTVDGFHHMRANYIKVNARLGARINKAVGNAGIQRLGIVAKFARLGFSLVPGLIAAEPSDGADV